MALIDAKSMTLTSAGDALFQTNVSEACQRKTTHEGRYAKPNTSNTWPMDVEGAKQSAGLLVLVKRMP